MSEFEFLNLSARPEAERARLIIQRWFDQYPEDHKMNLMNYLCSNKDLEHESAFFELVIYELLRRHCTEVLVHPKLSGRNKRPDFLVLLPSGERVYVEAKVVTDTMEGGAATSQLKRVFDSLDEIVSHDFFFADIEVEGIPEATASARLVRKTAERWLHGLNYDIVKRAFDAGDTSAFELKIPINGAELILRPIPKTSRGMPSRFIGAGPVLAGWLDTCGTVRKAIIKKASKYGPLD